MAENMRYRVACFCCQGLGARIQGDLSVAWLADYAAEDKGGGVQPQAWVFDL
jgi:hypothetical protein